MNTINRLVLCFALLLTALTLNAQTPPWQWAVGAGGATDDLGSDIAIDGQGNQYVTGRFEGTATFGPYILESSGNSDIFLAKLGPDGNWLWAIKAGGAENDWGRAVGLDSAGNPWLSGAFSGNVGFGPYILSSSGLRDVFVAKLDQFGNWLWAVRAGSVAGSGPGGIDVDSAGNTWLTGYFEGTADFGPYTFSSNGGQDIFLAKLGPDGNWLWAVSAGGATDDTGYGIAVDPAGNAILTGVFTGSATFGSDTFNSSGNIDIFVAKLDGAGNWLWTVSAGGTGFDASQDIEVDSAGNACLTGMFSYTSTFGPHALVSVGGIDTFAAKLNPSGNWLWAVNAGGPATDIGYGIAVDTAGNACLTGGFLNTANFGPYTINTTNAAPDIFAARLDPDGNWLWAVSAGGTGFYDIGYNIALDSAGNACLTGCIMYDAAFGPYTVSSGGGQDIFIAKLGCGTPVEDELSPSALSLGLSAKPNPFGASTSITIVGANQPGLPGQASVCVYDLRGRKVRSLSLASPGSFSLAWDGRDESGACCPTGIYLARLKQGGRIATLKLTLIK